MGKALRVALAIASMSVLSACSMLERYQLYESKEAQRVPVTEVAELSVRFEPNHRFMALGPLGLPVVPVAGDPSPVTQLEMIVTLNLKAPASFSLNSRPCLQAGPDTVCPHSVAVDQLMFLPQTSEIGAYWANRLDTALPIAEQPRMTDQDLFAIRVMAYKNERNELPSSRDAQWLKGYVSLTFHYTCPAECPKNLSLTMDDLARVNDQASSGGVRQFDRTAHTKYRFGWALQDGW